ncbi:MAG: MmgE/PrpD family protein [Xanthobacteraceae bacterium]
MTAIAQLGAFTAQLAGHEGTGSVGDKLKLHVVDTIGAWIAGSVTPEGRALAAFHAQVRRGGEPKRAALLDEVARNCALARLSEVDDIHLASMTTPGAIVIPAALTMARSWPEADASDLAAAILAGYEAMVRLGLAIDGPAILYRGIWPTYFAAPFGVAAVAARLLRLDEQHTAHALALGLALAAPGVGHHNAQTTSRWFAVGNAARNGLSAALAAQSGFTSDLALAESGFFANVYGITPRASMLTERLGGEPTLAQISFKPWCAARQTMAATQALREIIQEGVRADDIVTVHAAVLPPHLKMIDHGVKAGDRASYLTSLPYQMAVAALEPVTALALSARPDGPSPAMQSFMARIDVAGDDALLASYPSTWPARVAVVTRSGTREEEVTHVPGDPSRPFGVDDVADKFRRLVTPVLGRDSADSLLGRIVAGFDDGRSLAAVVDEVDQICRACIDMK